MQAEEYIPKRHAPEERKITEAFFDGVPEYVFKYVIQHLTSLFDHEGRKIWSRLTNLFPMIERVAVYTYSPIEVYDIRNLLLSRWRAADEARRDIRNPQALQDAAFLIDLATRHPEIKGKPIAETFKRMHEDFSQVLQADIRKEAGHPDSIEELRANWKRIERIEGGEKIVIDHSPIERIEHLNLPNRIEIHYHIMNDSDPEILFTHADAHLTECIQWFNDAHVSDKPTWMYIYGRDGKLIEPPGKHTNPFIFNLLEKYNNFLGATLSKHKKKVDQQYDITIGDVAGIFLEKVVKEWKGDRPPAAHFSITLPERIKSMVNKQYITEGRLNPLDEEDVEDRSADQYDSLAQRETTRRLRLYINELEEKSTNPTERAILRSYRRIIDSEYQEEKPSHYEIASMVKEETGKTISRQYVQKTEARIIAHLKEYLNK